MKTLKDKSRYMSLLLRHNPEKEKLSLDKEGWCDVDDLISKLDMTFDELVTVVDTNDKKRFAFNIDKTRIRASQGHSVSVELEYKKCDTTPRFLYHGTSSKLRDVLLKDGIRKMSRTHVHLSKDAETATKVGQRKSSDIVLLKIDGNRMIEDGIDVYISENGVYLADYVPSEYISI